MKPQSKTRSWMVILTLGLCFVMAILFVVAFAIESQTPTELTDNLTADTYKEEVAALLLDADPQAGSALIDRYECGACHRIGADRIAPSFVGIAQKAAERHPPLSAEAYLYEAIVYPAHFIVPDYPNAMPTDYATRLTQRELGDIIAYLLTADAQ